MQSLGVLERGRLGYHTGICTWIHRTLASQSQAFSGSWKAGSMRLYEHAVAKGQGNAHRKSIDAKLQIELCVGYAPFTQFQLHTNALGVASGSQNGTCIGKQGGCSHPPNPPAYGPAIVAVTHSHIKPISKRMSLYRNDILQWLGSCTQHK